MKTCLTIHAALVLGLPAVARNIGQSRRWCRDLLVRAGHEAGKGNVLTAAGLLALYMAGL